MATTTATITLNSSDILSNALSLTSTATLYDDSTTATGLSQCRMGRVNVYVTGSSFDLIDATPNAEDQTQYVYIANKNTNDTHYVEISIKDDLLGKLYAGDWCFFPWEANADTNDIKIDPSADDMVLEYMLFIDE